MKMSSKLQYLLGTAFIVCAVTTSLQLTGCTLDPKYQMDANDKCVEEATWTSTVVADGRPIYTCPGWYNERRAKDGAK